MNRIENILLTLATAAAFLIASTANANPDPCPKTGVKNNRPAVNREDPRDGLNGTPRIKTPTGTRLARDLELEEANADSGTKPEDGLPGRPVLRTPTGARSARDLEAEQTNRNAKLCPKNKSGHKTSNASGKRIDTVNRASKLLRKASGRIPIAEYNRDRNAELAERLSQMDKLAKSRKTQKNNKNGKDKNTTLDKALNATAINPNRLKVSTTKTERSNDGSAKITLSDGTVIWTGPDGDGLGTSITGPNGDETQVYPDGTVSRRNTKNPKSGTLTRKPNGTTIIYDGKEDELTITDKDGNTITRPMKFFEQINKTGMTYEELMDLMFPKRKGGAANGGKKSKHPKRNTTLDDALLYGGLSRDDLKDAVSVTPFKDTKSVKIVLKDGTVVWTGPDSDEHGSSVTKPSGDQVEVALDGTISTRKGEDGKLIQRRPDGIHLIHNKDGSVTITHPNGKRAKITTKQLIDLYKNEKDPGDLVRPKKNSN